MALAPPATRLVDLVGADLGKCRQPPTCRRCRRTTQDNMGYYMTSYDVMDAVSLSIYGIHDVNGEISKTRQVSAR